MANSQIQLPFLGNRNYIQSSTLFDYLIQNYPVSGKISYQFTKPIFTPCVQIMTEKKDGYSSFFAFGDDFENQLYIYENNCACDELRVGFDEEEIIKKTTFNGEIATFFAMKNIFCQTLVATTKALHKKCFALEENGQWLMVRIDLDSMPCDAEIEYSIEFINKKNKQLTCTKILAAGQSIGKIYFSWSTND